MAPAVRMRVLRPLLVATAVVDAARVVLSQWQREAFVQAYGQWRGLDMTTFLGQEVAQRDAPGHLDAALFSLLVALVVLALVRQVAAGAPWARNLAFVLAAIGALNTLAYIAVPAPWWDQALAVVVVALCVPLLLLLWYAPLVADVHERRDAAAARRGA